MLKRPKTYTVNDVSKNKSYESQVGYTVDLQGRPLKSPLKMPYLEVNKNTMSYAIDVFGEPIVYDERVLDKMLIEILDPCKMGCSYCVYDFNSTKTLGNKESFYNFIKRNGIHPFYKTLNIYGSEITSHLDLLEELGKHDILVQFPSSGFTLLDKSVIDVFKKAPKAKFDIRVGSHNLSLKKLEEIFTVYSNISSINRLGINHACIYHRDFETNYKRILDLYEIGYKSFSLFPYSRDPHQIQDPITREEVNEFSKLIQQLAYFKISEFKKGNDLAIDPFDGVFYENGTFHKNTYKNDLFFGEKPIQHVFIDGGIFVKKNRIFNHKCQTCSDKNVCTLSYTSNEVSGFHLEFGIDISSSDPCGTLVKETDGYSLSICEFTRAYEKVVRNYALYMHYLSKSSRALY